ncbi:hypothetical protein [Dolichospermum flos-aquae]|uniref:Uncharacterized protein n=1 Tax=Dolichospermum flos-aquae LEGE 04289 TaxID=1828708 RepID=A0ACC5Q3I3_DOLFA|nr:hypothetical protein [Dolichospermum flos-aquae]MBE9220136.1 hypothetical protein [Dolichospermum flos-aquae LEGE 04289]
MTRELLTGNREEVLGNFTFRYLCRFFSVYLLIFTVGWVEERNPTFVSYSVFRANKVQS